MDSDILARMEAEEADLTQKLDAVRQFLAVYRGASASKVRSASASVVPKQPRQIPTLAERMDKFGPYGQRIIDFVDRVLPGCDANPVATRDIVQYLDQQSIVITGQNKVNSLSALLARSSKMKGWGRAGWTRSVPEDGAHLIQLRLAGHSARNENGEAETSPDAGGVAAPSPDDRPRNLILDD